MFFYVDTLRTLLQTTFIYVKWPNYINNAEADCLIAQLLDTNLKQKLPQVYGCDALAVRVPVRSM